jgi:hypothetical protein
MEWWSDGVMECWSAGVLEWWSAGVVEWWSGGVVECFYSQTKKLIPPFSRPEAFVLHRPAFNH